MFIFLTHKAFQIRPRFFIPERDRSVFFNPQDNIQRAEVGSGLHFFLIY